VYAYEIKVINMSLYRVKQFYWSITSKIDDADTEFIRRFLNKEERELFNSLSTYEQKHSVNVARAVTDAMGKNDYNDTLVKASLLHDIGKTFKKLNPIEKSIIVILDSVSKGKLKRYKGLKTVDVYYNHGDKGYNILKNAGGYDERFLYLIKNHHNSFIVGDKELDLLIACDSNN
jgi:putative nucleotidyltransferase with HDIG domain